MREKFNFEDLKVYQKALDYIDYVYTITSKFPKSEIFGLVSQFQRAAQSIALNIGEGSGGSKAEFRQFIRIARRSICECIVCTDIALRRKYINNTESEQSRDMASELSRMLSGLLKSLLK
ncbi:four helix bundle protein [Patescibacteria group bacterium]|nr:four helix bundle protein [Patescibacteria group bacterium]